MKAYNSLLRFAEKIFDLGVNLIAAYLSYIITWYIVNDPAERALMDQAKPNGLVAAAFALAVFSILVYTNTGVYRPMRAERATFFVSRILTVNFSILGIYVIYAALVLHNYSFYLLWALFTFTLSSGLLIAKKCLMMLILHRVRSSKRNVKYVLLLTDSQEMANEYMREIRLNPTFGYIVIGYVGNTAIEGLKHLGTTGELDALLRKHQPDEVVMAFETVRRATITKYVSVCEDNCVKVLAVPAICGIFKSPRQMQQLGMLPMIDIRSTPLDQFSARFIKRLTDIVLSIFFIILTAPVMLFAAIGVKLSSPGPILFRQERVGRNNRVFTIYKFRSMRVNAEESSGWTTDHDPRKTKFGNFIRKYSIDELPQFFNVLKGDMSIVGPRPEMTYYVEQFRKTVPLYMLKHSVRPGITGLAQIHGLRGDTSIERRIEEDIYYIEHWTWFYDLKIILLTPFRAFNKHEKGPDDPSADAKEKKD